MLFVHSHQTELMGAHMHSAPVAVVYLLLLQIATVCDETQYVCFVSVCSYMHHACAHIPVSTQQSVCDLTLQALVLAVVVAPVQALCDHLICVCCSCCCTVLCLKDSRNNDCNL
jgi:hypothetical protein